MNNNLEIVRPEKPVVLPSKSLLNTIQLGYDIVLNPPPSEKYIDFREGDSVITTISTGFLHNDKPVISPNIKFDQRPGISKNPDSVLEDVDTGFGCSNTVVVECPKPEYKTHLCKEDYLGEFKSETEKELARHNLGVYGQKEVETIVKEIVARDTHSFATKEEVKNMMTDLDFVNSTTKSYANYQIPNNLFKL